jgi:DNA polymerase III subunit delta'
MPFRAVTGHHGILILLARAIARDTLPPVLLFAGPRGVGKHRIAAAVAEALNCPSAAASGEFELDACGSCPTCHRIARNVHPDVIVVEPGESGAIKVEQVRDVIDRTAFRPFEGRRRVVIVDSADAMAPPSQNALLKTLEEPPPGSIFILVSSIPDALLPTVRSRCPQLRFGALTTAEVVEILTRDHGYAPGDAHAAAIEADGSIARALERDAVDLVEARADARRVLEYVSRVDEPVRRLAAAEILKVKAATPAEERNLLATCLTSLLSLLRDVSVMATQADTRLLANADLEHDLRKLTSAFDERRSRQAFGAVDEALTALERNASPKLVADWLVMQL